MCWSKPRSKMRLRGKFDMEKKTIFSETKVRNTANDRYWYACKMFTILIDTVAIFALLLLGYHCGFELGLIALIVLWVIGFGKFKDIDGRYG